MPTSLSSSFVLFSGSNEALGVLHSRAHVMKIRAGCRGFQDPVASVLQVYIKYNMEFGDRIL